MSDEPLLRPDIKPRENWAVNLTLVASLLVSTVYMYFDIKFLKDAPACMNSQIRFFHIKARIVFIVHAIASFINVYDTMGMIFYRFNFKTFDDAVTYSSRLNKLRLLLTYAVMIPMLLIRKDPCSISIYQYTLLVPIFQVVTFQFVFHIWMQKHGFRCLSYQS